MLYKNMMLILYFVIITILLYYFRLEISSTFALITKKPLLLASTLILTVIAIWQQSQNYCLINNFTKDRYFPTFMIWGTSGLVNYLLPFQSGIIVRSILMKKLNIPLIKSVQHSGKLILNGLLYSIFIILILGALQKLNIVLNDKITLSIFTLLVLCAIVTKKFNRQFSKFWIVTYASLNQMITSTIAYYIAFDFADNPISIQESLLLTCSSIISSVIAITPNGLGITESFIFFFNHLFDMKLNNIIQAVLFLRICHIITSIPISIMFIIFNRKLQKENH